MVATQRSGKDAIGWIAMVGAARRGAVESGRERQERMGRQVSGESSVGKCRIGRSGKSWTIEHWPYRAGVGWQAGVGGRRKPSIDGDRSGRIAVGSAGRQRRAQERQEWNGRYTSGEHGDGLRWTASEWQDWALTNSDSVVRCAAELEFSLGAVQ